MRSASSSSIFISDFVLLGRADTRARAAAGSYIKGGLEWDHGGLVGGGGRKAYTNAQRDEIGEDFGELEGWFF
jgi:hypothetical protein